MPTTATIADRAAHLNRRALATEGHATANRDDSADELHRQHASPIEFAEAMQYRLQVRNTATAGFGRDAPDERHRQQCANHTERHRKEPAPKRYAMRPDQQCIPQRVAGGEHRAKRNPHNASQQANQRSAREQPPPLLIDIKISSELRACFGLRDSMILRRLNRR
jgi:hypothetical protein